MLLLLRALRDEVRPIADLERAASVHPRRDAALHLVVVCIIVRGRIALLFGL